MRGRTNLSSGGMSLNADTATYIVANGATVTAGDFVEHETKPSEQSMDFCPIASKRIDGTYSALYKSDKTVAIFKTIGVESTVTDTIQASIKALDAKDGYLYIADSSNNLTKYSIATDGTLSQVSTVSNGAIINKINIVGDKIVLLQTLGSTYSAKLYSLDLELITTQTIATAVANVVSGNWYDTWTINDGVYYIVSGVLYSIVVSNNAMTIAKLISYSYSAIWWGVVIGDELLLNLGDGTYRKYMKFNSIDKTSVAFSCPSALKSDTSPSVAYMGNRFITTNSTTINLNEYNASTNAVTVINSKAQDTNYVGVSLIDDNTLYLFGSVGTNYSLKFKSITNNGNTISDMVDTEVVKNYTGATGNPIGIAKDSGVAGDSVVVYIPTVVEG